MKLIRFELADQREYGVVKNNIIYPIQGSLYGTFTVNETRPIPLTQVKILSPVTPSKIVCVVGNYRKHNQEMGRDPNAGSEFPKFFYKPVTGLIGPDDKIRIPKNIEGEVHFEGELAVVIKKTPRNIRERDFREFVLGYTIMNDVSARHYSKRDGDLFRSKSYDSFAPIGPCIETNHVGRTRIQVRLNNEVKQQGGTEDMIHSVGALIAYLSTFLTLLPGDVVSTGTPEGVGPMKAGDLIEVDVEKVGSLRNFVI